MNPTVVNSNCWVVGSEPSGLTRTLAHLSLLGQHLESDLKVTQICHWSWLMNNSCIRTISFFVFLIWMERQTSTINAVFPTHLFVPCCRERRWICTSWRRKKIGICWIRRLLFFCSLISSQGLLIARRFVRSSWSISLILSAVNDLICLILKMLKAFKLEW